MSNEIISVLEYMEKEKGIPRAEMIQVIAGSIKNASLKGVNAGLDIKVDINPKSGALSAFALYKVVDSVSDPKVEIHIEKAQEIRPGAALGDVIEKPIVLGDLGRIAATAARQAIAQRVRQWEKDRIQDEYKDMVGDVVSGTIRRRERGDWIVDLGKAEAVMPVREQIPGEDYSPGERIRALLQSIEQTPRGPEIILSRANPRFVQRLFQLEITEIADGTVTIERFAREPGYRTKIAVASRDPKVDPVGACVGARGARVKTIVRELGAEKVDIIMFHADPRQMVVEALKPAIPRNVVVDEKNKRISLEVDERDLALAIGRKGQNAKLTSKLLGWRLDIAKANSGARGFNEKKQVAVASLHQIPGISDAQSSRLVDMGITSPDAFEGVEVSDLVDAGFEESEAN
jgi:N utilization substance protein A